MGPHPRQVLCIGTHQWVLVIFGGRTGTCNVCKPNSNNQWLCANGFRPADQFKETSSASSKSQCCFHCFVPKHVENPESGKIRPSQHQTVCCPSVMSSELQRMRKLYIQQAWEFFIVFTIPLWFPCKHSKSNGFWCFILLNKNITTPAKWQLKKYFANWQTTKQRMGCWGKDKNLIDQSVFCFWVEIWLQQNVDFCSNQIMSLWLDPSCKVRPDIKN